MVRVRNHLKLGKKNNLSWDVFVSFFLIKLSKNSIHNKPKKAECRVRLAHQRKSIED